MIYLVVDKESKNWLQLEAQNIRDAKISACAIFQHNECSGQIIRIAKLTKSGEVRNIAVKHGNSGWVRYYKNGLKIKTK